VGIQVTTGPARDRGKVDADGVGVGGRVGGLVGRGGGVVCGGGVEEGVGLGDDDGLRDDVEEEAVVVVVVEDGVVGVVVEDVLPDGLRVGVAAGGEEQADSRMEESSTTEVSRPLAAGLPTRWFDLIPPRCRCTHGRGESQRSSLVVSHWVPTVPPATASTRT
jgi:hypothetical protein